MSMMTCVVSVTKTSIEPLVPAGTTAAFASSVPRRSFKIDTVGVGGFPVGQAVRKLREPVGTTVKFSEYAWAVEGMLQRVLLNTGIVLVSLAFIAGDPKLSPVALRVSTNRQGTMATKAMELLNGVPDAASGVGRAAWNFSLSSGSRCADDASQKAGACQVEIGRSVFRLRFCPVAGATKSRKTSDTAVTRDVSFSIRWDLLFRSEEHTSE